MRPERPAALHPRRELPRDTAWHRGLNSFNNR
jgi:hypothetical protein